MSRHKAKQQFNGRSVAQEMKKRGIFVKTASFPALAEEAGAAYKNIDQVMALWKKGLVRFYKIRKKYLLYK